MDHEHVWKPVPGLVYALRRCVDCNVLARTSNSIVKIQLCKVCKGPAHHLRLGSAYCETHLSKPGNLRSLKEMSEAEIQALEKLYGKPVKRPAKS